MFCVVYRTGGSARFQWHRSIVFQTRQEAEGALSAVLVAGYKGHIEDYERSLRIGLPETFEPGDPIPGNEV